MTAITVAGPVGAGDLGATWAAWVRLGLVVALAAQVGACAPRSVARKSGSPARNRRAPWRAEELTAAAAIDEVAIDRWGSLLAFASDRSGASELWKLPLDGCVAVPPRRETNAGEHVAGLTWAPDGSFLVFEMDHGGDERPDLWIQRGFDPPEALAVTPTAEQGARVSPDGQQLAFAVDGEHPFRFNLARMDLATRRVEVLTDEPVNVLSPRWSPDGKRLVGTRSPDEQKGELLVVEVATRATRRIAPTERDGILWPLDFLADGTLLALTTNAGGFHQLALVSLESGAVTLVGRGDHDVERARLADTNRVFYTRNVDGVTQLVEARYEAATRSLRELHALDAAGVLTDLTVDRSGDHLVAVREATDRPAALVTWRADRSSLEPIYS